MTSRTRYNFYVNLAFAWTFCAQECYGVNWKNFNCKESKANLVFIADGIGIIEENLTQQKQLLRRLLNSFWENDLKNQTRLNVSFYLQEHGGKDFNVFREVPGIDNYTLQSNLTEPTFNSSDDNPDDKFEYFAASTRRYIESTLISKSPDEANDTLFLIVKDARPVTKYIVELSYEEKIKWSYLEKQIVEIDLLLPGSETSTRIQVKLASDQSKWDTLGGQGTTLGLLLCKHCDPGWLTYRSSTDPQIACYKLSPNSVRPNGPAGTCVRLNASPVTIETKSELKFVRENMINLCKSTGSSECDDGFKVAIGLQRVDWDLGQRHRWLAGNKPLVLHHWRKGYPLRGATAECVVWDFQRTASIREKEYYDDGWEDVGCGELAGTMTLCETSIVLEPPEVTINVVNELAHGLRGGFERILQKGDFLLLSDMLVFWAGMAIFDKVSEQSVLFSNNRIQNISDLVDIEEISFPCTDYWDYCPYSMLCDHSMDTLSGIYESVCSKGKRVCDYRSQFKCVSDRACIPKEARCDMVKDCKDGSDEMNCEPCSNLLCEDGRCLPKHWFYDAQIDCSSPGRATIKEVGYRQHTSECVLTCNVSQCVTADMMGDGVIDCHGPEGHIDESLGILETATCTDGHGIVTGEWAPRCIYVLDHLGVMIGCRFLDHLQNCETFTCPVGYAKCHHSYCIPRHMTMDANPDCPFGEGNDLDYDCIGGFLCMDALCLGLDLVCDGRKHCPSGEDEIYCNIACTHGFLCLNGAVIVTDYNKTDPVTDLSFVDSRTRFLNLSGIDLSLVFPNKLGHNLNNLINICFSGCNITSVYLDHIDTRLLNNVVLFDLSHNNIERIDQEFTEVQFLVFYYMFHLHMFNLSYNRNLHLIHEDSFSQLVELSVLDLSYTAIRSFPDSFFKQFKHLTALNVSHTLIARIQAVTDPLFVVSLQQLDLRGNELMKVNPELFLNVRVSENLYMDHFPECCPQVVGETIPDYVCIASPDPLSSCTHLLEEVLVLWTLGTISILGNGATLILTLCGKRVSIKRAKGQLVGHLALSDFMMGVYALIIAGSDMYYSTNYVWHVREWINSTLCQTAGVLATTSTLVSTFLVFFISMDQLMKARLTHNKQTNSWISKRVVFLIIAATWIVGVILATIPTIRGLDHWAIYSTNAVCLQLPISVPLHSGWEYTTSVFIFLPFFLVLCTICIQFLLACGFNHEETVQNQNGVQNNQRRPDSQQVIANRTLSRVAMLNSLFRANFCFLGFLALCGFKFSTGARLYVAVWALPLISAMNAVLLNIPLLNHVFMELVKKFMFQ